MLYQIMDGTVSAGGVPILSHIDFEIRGTEKIAVAGKNGAGKTTLLRLLAGEISLDRDDKRNGPGIMASRRLTVGMMRQQPFGDTSCTVEEELLKGCPGREVAGKNGTGLSSSAIFSEWDRERFDYEREYDILFTGFGFSKEDKKKKLSEFSGGEQTKIALIRLLLEKPDILLLDEPTNHLDLETVQWLEEYLRQYDKAVVMVSHDRFFLDRTALVVYEVAGGKLTRYVGNYSAYREQKRKQLSLQKKAYESQQEELERLNSVVERFKHKPTKASFARAKKKAMERMNRVEKPEEDDIHIFTGELTPLIIGSKWVFESEHLKIGYDRALLEITLRIRRGQKIGILGPNGSGKTTFLKTVAGFLPPLDGEMSVGVNITMGYFDQLSAQVTSEKTVADHFHDLFPALTEKEARSILGAYLFGGREAQKLVSTLSGGEKARLVLAELLQSRPNFLVLDEPTNHMDIQAKETLESAFRAYTGTLLFVSHDRYFLSQVADSLLIFENHSVMYYPFGYEHYLERKRKSEGEGGLAAQMKAEEQALIAGMRAVPKAERHRFKEISAEDAYIDWRLRLVSEKMIPAGVQAGELYAAMEAMKQEWMVSEDFWSGKRWEKETEYTELCRRYEETDAVWHELCLEWYAVWSGEENE